MRYSAWKSNPAIVLLAMFASGAAAQDATPVVDFDCAEVGHLWEDATKEELRDANLHNRSTKLYFNQKLFDKAAREAELAVHIDGTEAEYWMRLGMAYAELGCDGAAGDAFERALALSEEDDEKLHEQASTNRAYYWQNRFEAGIEQIGEQDFELAAEKFLSAIAIDSTDVRGWRNLGVTYIQLQENVASVDAFKTALELEPDDEKTRDFYRQAARNLAVERYTEARSATFADSTKAQGIEQMKNALGMFDEIIALDPPTGELSGYLGDMAVIWQSLGDAYPTESPDAHTAYMNALDFYRRSALRSYEAAEADGETPLTLNTDTEFLMSAIGCFNAADEDDSTLAYARKLVDVAPRDARGYRIVGASLQEAGNTEGALAYILMGQCMDEEEGKKVESINDHFMQLIRTYQPSDDIIKASIENLESPDEIRVAERGTDRSEAWIFWTKGFADCYYNGQFVGKVEFAQQSAS